MKKFTFLLTILISLAFWTCKTDTKWKGQEPLQKVSTKTRPIEYQLKKTWLLGNGIYCSNEFTGARLNGVVLTEDTVVTALINPENTPINSSPWYAFKMWADSPKAIQLKITYLDGVAHRYYPKVSRDGINWTKIDSSFYLTDTASISNNEPPKFCYLNLTLSSDTLWIAAQELFTSKEIYGWADKLAEKPFVSVSEIGKSSEGRPIKLLRIGNPESKNLVMVLSRQHPPEVTGWLAMKWFVEMLCEENPLAESFMEKFQVLVVPLVNPDGVDNGHWRHNAYGIDLNRDWEDFNQPETRTIRDFAETEISKGGKFYFSVDFHSTQEDIYYTIDPKLKGNLPGLVPELINAVGNEIPGYEPNIRPNDINEPRISSTSFFYNKFGAEALTYEIGDDTPHELIEQKGKLTALKLMEIMNTKIN